MVWLPAFVIFNVRTDVDARGYTTTTTGRTDTVRASAPEVDSGRKIPWASPGTGNPCQYCAWLFSRTLYQLSYSLVVVVVCVCNSFERARSPDNYEPLACLCSVLTHTLLYSSCCLSACGDVAENEIASIV